MGKILFSCFVGILILGLGSCGDEGFPVPPASTVPKFTVSIDNDEFAPATATFTNISIIPERAGEVSYFWTFGDGTSSTQTNPVHLYETSGVYPVTLVIVATASGEIVEASQNIIIKDPNASGIPVFFTDGSTVYRALINDDAPIAFSLGITSLGDSYGMALDTVNNKLYITDYDADKILVANADGTGLQDFRINVGGPDGIAIDYANAMLYWDTDNGIRRADMNSTVLTQMEDFVTGQATEDPEGVSIDPVSGYVFWNTYNKGVWRKHVSGTGQQEIVPDFDGTGSGGGGGSTLIVGSRIFFDVYVASGDIWIKSANLDGTGVSTVATGITRVVFGLAYDAVNDKIYWGDRNAGKIMRANRNGTGSEAWLTGFSTRGIVIGKEIKPEEE